MNKLNLLMAKWKAGSIRDPDLHLALKIINDYRNERLRDEGKSENKQGTATVPGEDHCSDAERSKTKGLRKGLQGGATRDNPKNKNTI
jgi:hypothetical protein